MSFSKVIVAKAWVRQGGRCAYCGKQLNPNNHDRGERGGWHPHHRRPRVDNGTDTLRNCVIFCINPPNCHLYIGHGGNWQDREPLNDSELPHLYHGKRIIEKRRAARRKRNRRR